MKPLISTPYDIAVIEPHVDDAFLSLGWHIEQWVKRGQRVAIVSVYSAGRRGEEAKAYARAVGAEPILLGHTRTKRGQPLLPSVFWTLGDSDQKPSGISIEAKRWIGPLAVTHPDHIVVRERMHPNWSEFYLDMPYSIVQRNSERVLDLIQNCIVTSYLKPPVRKYRHIPLFKSQSKYFHYNPKEKLRETFEMIIELPPVVMHV